MYWSLSVGARHTFSSIGLLSSDRFANDIDENRPVRRSSTYRNVEPSTVIEASYDVSYLLPAVADLPGLAGRVLKRHVRCSFVDGRAIEIRQEGL